MENKNKGVKVLRRRSFTWVVFTVLPYNTQRNSRDEWFIIIIIRGMKFTMVWK